MIASTHTADPDESSMVIYHFSKGLLQLEKPSFIFYFSNLKQNHWEGREGTVKPV